jgi:hypothetical protein
MRTRGTESDTRNNHADCSAVGNTGRVEVNCAPQSPTQEPRVDVPVVGSGQWGPDIGSFAPNTELHLELRGPNREPMELGEYGTMRTDSDGDRRTEGLRWEHARDEPIGHYTVIVSGQGVSGEVETVEDRFLVSGEVPLDPVTS